MSKICHGKFSTIVFPIPLNFVTPFMKDFKGLDLLKSNVVSDKNKEPLVPIAQ